MSRNKYPEKTVKLITDSAARLFMEKGYDKTSLQDIIDDTGLSKGAIYHHFASKEDIFQRICLQFGEETERVYGSIRDHKGMTGLEKLREMFRACLRMSGQRDLMDMRPYFLDNPRFLAMQIQGVLDDAAPNYILPILLQGIEDGSIKTRRPRELAEVIMFLCSVWLSPLLRPIDAETLRAKLDMFRELMVAAGVDFIDDETVEEYLKFSTH